MKLSRNIILVAALSLFVFGSCEKEVIPEAPVSSEIQLSQTSVTAGPEGGQFTIDVTSSADWKIAGYCDWVEFDSQSGKKGTPLVFNVGPNSTDENRSADFKIFSGDAVETFSILSTPSINFELESKVQDGEDKPSLVDKANIPSEAGKFAVVLVTNATDIEVEYAEGADKWLENTQVTTELTGRAIYEFSAKKSTSFKNREGLIRFKSASADKTLSFNVIQAQHDTVFVEGGEKFIKGLEAFDITLTVKGNVPFKYTLPSWLVETEKVEGEPDEASGLKATTIKIHADESLGSRAATVKFQEVKGGYYPKLYGSVYIKQQNPNPTFVTIADEDLQRCLVDAEWILSEPGSDQCEVLSNGMSATELTVMDPVKDFSGLKTFKQLTTLCLRNNEIASADLTPIAGLTSVKVSHTLALTSVKLGDKVKKMEFDHIEDDYMTAKSFTVTGANVEEINASSMSFMLGFGYDECASMDFTACPNLKKLYVFRESWGSSPLKSIYVTAAQKAAIDDGKIETLKSEQSKWVVK